MKRPLIFVVTATMAITLSACNDAEDDSTGDNDQELPAETDEETNDDAENETETENGENGSEGAPSDDDTGTDNGTEEDETVEENGAAENEDGTATEDVDLLFFDEEALNMYREARTVTADSTEDLPVAAVEEWLNGPESDELTNLLADEGVHVQYVEDQDGTAHISFSPEVTNANFGSSAEVGFLDQVAHIMAQFGYESTQFLLDGEVQESLFGHSDTSEPYTPEDDLTNYDEIDG